MMQWRTNKSKSCITMTNTPVAGIPSAARDIHTQMMINIVIDHKVAYTAFKQAEAAAWVHENVPMATHIPVKVLASRIKSGFRRGGRISELVDGVRAVKTNRVARWRGREYHDPHWTPRGRATALQLRNRRLAWAYEDGVKTTTAWRGQGFGPACR